jgi:hypothetical protein
VAIWKNPPSEGYLMIWSDFGQLTGAILLIIGALLPVVNPLGDAPIFLRMTPGCDESTRAFLAKRIAFYSFFMVRRRDDSSSLSCFD